MENRFIRTVASAGDDRLSNASSTKSLVSFDDSFEINHPPSVPERRRSKRQRPRKKDEDNDRPHVLIIKGNISSTFTTV